METTFRGITITKEQIQKALAGFRAQYPDPDDFDNWLQKRSYKFAIRLDDRLYPPKHILSVVTGIPTTDFSGGEQTNRVFRQLGFDVVEK
jgi:5-methylcytosine-specific restriction protein A